VKFDRSLEGRSKVYHMHTIQSIYTTYKYITYYSTSYGLCNQNNRTNTLGAQHSERKL
jgi:hypothetical protein